MSLLMDALKQAEHAKRGSREDADTPSGQAVVEPAPDAEAEAEPVPATATNAQMMELSLSPIELVQEQAIQETVEFDIIPEPESTEITAAPPEIPDTAIQPDPDESIDDLLQALEEQAQVASTVEAPAEIRDETPADSPPPEPPQTVKATTPDNGAQAATRVLAASEARLAMQRRRSLYGTIGLGVVMLIAMVGYYYGAALSHNQPQLLVPQVPDFAAQDQLGEPAEASAPPVQNTWRTANVSTDSRSAQEPQPVDQPVEDSESFSPVTIAQPAIAARPPGAGISISRSTRSNLISDSLQTAYRDYQAGRYAQAADGYRRVLAGEPGNRDARLGLAALAVHKGETETARTLYREQLRLDPRDSAAHAGLASLQDQPSAATESELKLLLAEQPEVAQLHFTLANLYAAQARWPLAQQAYFEAQRLSPQHPDYAFNLAISLEHLGQAQAALEYYRRAMSLATRKPASFAVGTAERRVRALTGQTGP